MRLRSWRAPQRGALGGRAVVLAIGQALGAHEALGRPDVLPGFFEVVHHLFENGVFVGHNLSIRAGIARSPSCFAFSGEHADWALLRKRGRMNKP